MGVLVYTNLKFELQQKIRGAMLRGYYLGREKILTDRQEVDFGLLHHDFIDEKVKDIMSLFEEYEIKEKI